MKKNASINFALSIQPALKRTSHTVENSKERNIKETEKPRSDRERRERTYWCGERAQRLYHDLPDAARRLTNRMCLGANLSIISLPSLFVTLPILLQRETCRCYILADPRLACFLSCFLRVVAITDHRAPRCVASMDARKLFFKAKLSNAFFRKIFVFWLIYYSKIGDGFIS